jgi:hypothetical protein
MLSEHQPGPGQVAVIAPNGFDFLPPVSIVKAKELIAAGLAQKVYAGLEEPDRWSLQILPLPGENLHTPRQ